MKHSFGQFMLTMLLAGVILAGGWLGICNLGLILPSGTDGYELHDMAALNEESFIATLSAAPLSPFTDQGFPEGADLVDPGSEEFNQYYNVLSGITYDNAILNSLSETLSGYFDAYTNDNVLAYSEAIATWADDRGIWLLLQTTCELEIGTYHLQMGLHSRDGFRILRVIQDSATHVQLSPDSTLLERVSDACSEFMAYWQSYAAEIQGEGYETYAMVLDDMGELAEYPMHLPIPLETTQPSRTELDGTRCHVYYPAEGGEIVIIYDFIGMHITGAAFIPEA